MSIFRKQEEDAGLAEIKDAIVMAVNNIKAETVHSVSGEDAERYATAICLLCEEYRKL